MTDVYTPPALSDIEPGTPLAVAADNDVVALTVSYGLSRSTETVFQQGAFLHPFLRSTRYDARTFSIVRDGGWPADPLLSIIDPPLGGGLQPTLYSPAAQWALRGAPVTATTYADRSGNGSHLTGGTPIPAPGSTPGQLSVIFGPGSAGSLSRTTDAALRLSAEVTVTLKCWRRPAGTSQVLFELGGTGGMGANGNVLYELGVGSGGGLYYYSETGSQVGHAVGTSGLVPQTWSFISLQRDAAATDIRLGIDGAYENLVGVAPTGGGQAFMTIGNEPDFGLPWLGGLEDLCVWPTRLTDAELLVLRKAAMGIS